VQLYLLIFLPTRPYTGVCHYTIIALTISDTFRIRDFMNYTFRRVTTRSLRVRYHTVLRSLIASVKCPDMSIEFRLTVTETILCGFQRPIGQRRVATPTNENLYELEIYDLQIHKRHDLSTQSRLTVVQTIRVGSRGQRARRRVNDQVNKSPFN
jgi:hypothetical protein